MVMCLNVCLPLDVWLEQKKKKLSLKRNILIHILKTLVGLSRPLG